MATPRPQLAAFDPNISPVLQTASHDQLLPLVRYLVAGGITCTLSPEARREPEEHILDLQIEIQRFGANTFSNFFTGTGVTYRQVVCDVAKEKFAIQSSRMSVFEIEEEMLRSIPTKDEQGSNLRSLLTRNAPMLASEGFKQAGFLPYKYAVIIANKCSRFVLKRGLKAAANRAITFGIKRATSAFTGPVGWVITIADIASTVWKAAGPNLAVTQPCVIYIAALRRSLIDNELRKLFLIHKRKRKNLLLPGWGLWNLDNSWALVHFAGFIGTTGLVLWTRLTVVWILPAIVVWLLSQLHAQTSFQPEVNEALFTIEQLQGNQNLER